MRRDGATRLALWLLVFCGLALVVDNAHRPLAHPDEGRYAEISREMAEGGDWVTPRLNGIKYLEKPPLQYWAGAVAMRAFGAEPFAARLYVNLCALLTLGLVAFTARRLVSPDAALGAVLALAASPYFVALAGVVTLDMGLTLWTTATFCAYALAQAQPEGSRAGRRLMLGAWAAMALAVLSKGLVGMAIPLATLALHCLAQRSAAPLARMEWARGLAVFLAIAAPWFVAVSLANPEFARFFFVHEHLQRFVADGHGRHEPWWYFLAIVALGFLPWMLALPAAAVHGWRAGAQDGAGVLRMALSWGAFVLAFFSLSSSKLPAYMLPAFPMLAIVLGRYLAEAPTRRLAAWIAPMSLAAVVLVAVAWWSPQHGREAWSRELYAQARPWAIAAAAMLLATCVAAPLVLRAGRRWPGVALVAIGVVLTVDLAAEGYERMSPRQSGLMASRVLAPHLEPATRLYSVNIYDQTLPFYLRRTLTLVQYRDEFATGLDAEPHLGIARHEDFKARWQEPGEAVAIIHPDTFLVLRAQGLPMQVLHEDPRRVLVRKP